jgi:membrane-associated phospholipid phosphatase
MRCLLTHGVHYTSFFAVTRCFQSIHLISSMFFWSVFTKLADTTVLMPLAVALAAWLAYEGRWRAAINWLFLFCAGLGIVLISKVAYVGWGIGVASLDFKGFSGHAMRIAAVMPVLCTLLVQSRTKFAVNLALLFAVCFSIAIGISRLVLHQHSISEVVTGLLLGGAIGFGFLALEQVRMPMPLNAIVIASFIMVMTPGLMAKPAPTERWIEDIALYLSGRDQPYRHSEHHKLP